jgi:antitoxin ParD1/3/4
MSLNLSLPNELESRVREHDASGLYGSASEVIREALRLFEIYHAARKAQLASLKAQINQGMADVNAGRIGPVDMADIKLQGRRLKNAG